MIFEAMEGPVCDVTAFAGVLFPHANEAPDTAGCMSRCPEYL
jgi:hypothetical protein